MRIVKPLTILIYKIGGYIDPQLIVRQVTEY